MSDADGDDDDDEPPAFLKRSKPQAAEVIHTYTTTTKNYTEKPKQQQRPIEPLIPTRKQQPRYLIFGFVVLAMWMFFLTMYIMFHSVASSSPLPPPIIVASKKFNSNSKWIFPFTLFTADQSMWMTMTVSNLHFDRILRYDVCCKQNAVYACRSVSKNMGVDGFVVSPNILKIQILHPDMSGAACKFIWAERSAE